MLGLSKIFAAAKSFIKDRSIPCLAVNESGRDRDSIRDHLANLEVNRSIDLLYTNRMVSRISRADVVGDTRFVLSMFDVSENADYEKHIDTAFLALEGNDRLPYRVVTQLIKKLGREPSGRIYFNPDKLKNLSLDETMVCVDMLKNHQTNQRILVRDYGWPLGHSL